MKRPLTESERTTLTCALRCAAEKYADNSKLLREPDASLLSPGHAKRLAEQFERQCNDAVKMAELIEEAEEVTLES